MVTKDFNGKFHKQYTYIASKYEFRFNVVTGRFEYRPLKKGKVDLRANWNIYDDRVRASLLLDLFEHDLDITNTKFDIFIESELMSPEYNPFDEYFEHLDKWDEKTDYISELAKTIDTDNNERFSEVLKRFLVGTLDCLLSEDAVNDVCLVFQSGQGTGKTRWMRSLLPRKFQSEYLYEGNIDTKNKDHTQYLSQYWFIHLDELETLKSNDITAIKSYITRQRISLRKAYGRYKTNLVRRASFLGSVNDDKFLTDTTGNRRWLVFKTFDIDYQHNVDVDKMWAQVFHLWSNGYKHWFDIDEIKDINNQNERFREISLEEELALKNFEFPDKNSSGELMSTSDMMLKIAEVNPNLMVKLNSIKLGKAVGHRHCKFKKRVGGINKYWVNFIGEIPGEIQGETNNNNNNSNNNGNDPDDDLPF